MSNRASTYNKQSWLAQAGFEPPEIPYVAKLETAKEALNLTKKDPNSYGEAKQRRVDAIRHVISTGSIDTELARRHLSGRRAV